MATIQDLINVNIFTLQVTGDPGKAITKVFCCDLLSIAMGKAPEGSAWVTVMANKNTLAVASLADVSCIVLAEGMLFCAEDLERAEKEGIAVFSTELPVFDASLKIQELLP